MSNKKKTVQMMVATEAVYALLMGGLQSLGAPSFVRLFTDVLLFALVVATVWYLVKERQGIRLTIYEYGPVILFAAFSFVSFLLARVWFVTAAAAFRNWFHGFVFFAICYFVVDGTLINKMALFLKGLYLANFLASLAQFVVFEMTREKVKGDDVVGILVDNGANNVLICVLLIFVITDVCEAKKLDWFSLVFIFSSMVLAAIEELKVYYFEFMFIVVGIVFLYMVFKKISWKFALKMLVIMILALACGLVLLGIFYPRHLMYISSLRNYKYYEEMSSKSYPISRVHPLRDIREQFFGDNLKEIILGRGFGMTFYYDTHYFYVCHQKLLFEEGVVGLIIYSSFYVINGVRVFVNIIKTKCSDKKDVMALALLGFCLLVMCYDSSLYKEISYLIFFALAATMRKQDD